MSHADSDFRIGEILLRPRRLEVVRNGKTVAVEPKVMALLVSLAARGGETVGRDRLMAEVWPEVHVSEDALHRCIWKARRALGDNGAAPRILGTVSRLGYRLLVPVSAAATVVPIVGLPPPARRFTAAVAAAVAVSLAVAVIIYSRPAAEPPAAVPAAVPLTALPGYETRPAFSPDGGRVVFQHYRRTGPLAGQSDLVLTAVDGGGQPIDLTATADDEASPQWARGSDRIAFRRLSGAECLLVVLDVDTRAESTIGACDAGTHSTLAWSADDRAILHNGYGPDRRTTRIVATNIETAATTPITAPPDGASDRDPAVSPDGRTVAFLRSRLEGLDEIYVREPGGEERRITRDAQRVAGVAWATDGRRLTFSSERSGVFRLWSVGLHDGAPQPIDVVGMNATTPAYSSRGALAYEEWKSEINVRRLTIGDGEFTAAPVVESSRWDWEPRWSPDGRQLAFLTNRSGPTEVWLATPGAASRRLAVLAQPAGTWLRWSPDGRLLAFAAPVDGRFRVHLLRLADEPTTVLPDGGGDSRAPSWSADGRWVYFGSDRDGRWQIWKAPAGGGAAVRVTAQGGLAALESADGRWLYYVKADEAGLWRRRVGTTVEELVTAAVAPGALSWDLSIEAAYYARPSLPGGTPAALMRVPLDGGPEVRAGWLEPPAGYPEWYGASGFSVSPDGSAVTIASIDRSDSDLWLISAPPFRTPAAVAVRPAAGSRAGRPRAALDR